MKWHGDNGRTRLAGAVMRSQPDSRLVSLLREGHDRAFEEIVRRYRPSLVTFAGCIVPGHKAEDVVQESLARAHTALGRGDAAINLKPWLYTIVRNRALNMLRDEPAFDHLDENYDGVPQPPEVAARREELAALIANVRGLPGPQREAIVKRELEGRSHEEIASSLGVSAGAVRGLIYRARTALRDGAGILIPMPLVRLLLSAGSASPEATGAAGTAAGLAAGGGGIAAKAGATLGVAVIAVGSGFAIQHRNSGPNEDQARSTQAFRAHDGGRSSATRISGAGFGREDESGRDRPGSGDSSGRDGHEGSGSSSGPGPGSHSGSGSSGEGSGAGDGGSSGSGDGGGGGGGESSGDGDDGGSSSSGTSGSGDDGGGSSGEGSGTSGSDDGGGGSSDETSGTSGSDDGGGSSDSGSSGSDDETTTTTTTTDDGGTSGSG
jgi:RNA polymerase sigma factor (sigma-70 family)